MDFIYTWIKNIIVYIILLNVVMNLLGKSSYKKYIGVFTGMILVILVVSPIIKLIRASNTFDYNFETKNFALNANDISNDIIEMEDKQKDTIYKEYKEKIKEQITSLIKKQDLNPVSIEVEIIEDKESKDFGKISQVNVIANHKQSNTTKESNTQKITIDKIKIEDINSNNENDNEEEDSGASEILSVEETMLKNTLADFYNISLDNINISIQE